MKNIISYIIARLKERSTWLGLVGLLSSIGISLKPESTEAIIALGMAAASTIAVFTTDKPDA
jgi:hypothetical protein